MYAMKTSNGILCLFTVDVLCKHKAKKKIK